MGKTSILIRTRMGQLERRPAQYRRRFAVPLICALVLYAGSGQLAAKAADSGATAAASPGAVVRMSDKPLGFTPGVVRIKAGDTVEWDNTAVTIHSITADPSKAAKAVDVELPPGAKAFDSGFLVPGQTFRYTFKVRGSYKYFCIPHEGDKMFGEVVVQ